MATERLILEKSLRINEIISSLLHKTQAVASLAIRTDGLVANFDKAAAAIVDHPAILNVLMAPGGVVTDVYPDEGNEGVLGLDFFEEGAGNKEARLALEKDELVFGGPFPLRQGGGLGLVGRLPVWQSGREKGEKRFWGMVSVTLKYPEVLEGADLDSLAAQGFVYEIWRITPDAGQRQTIAGQAGRISDMNFVERPIPLLNADWHFRLAPIRFWYQRFESWFFIAVTLIISSLITIIAQNNLTLRSMRADLEKLIMTDPLTGLLNRKGLFGRLEELVGRAEPFRLYYMDLNYFKQTNDRYGHQIGDLVLLEFCRRIKRHLSREQVFGRIGGDEFVVALSRMTPAEMDSLWRKIDGDFKRPAKITRDCEIALSFSRGEADFPEESRSYGQLLNLADARMFENKRGQYSQQQRRRRTDWAVECA